MAELFNGHLFFHALLFVFLASLPGRTTFLMIIMASRTKSSRVLIGAGFAFAAQCAISVAIGNVLSFVPEAMLHAVVGFLFIYFGYHFWRLSRLPEASFQGLPDVTIRKVFSVVFAGEWGDVSQIAIATYSAEHKEKTTVFLAALAALWLTMVVAVCSGKILRRSLRPQRIQWIAAIGFLGVGIYMLARAVFG